jgi:hypothetical protein
MMTTAIVRSGPNTPERSPPRTPGTPTMNRTLSAESRRGVSTPGSARVRSGGSRERPGSKGRPGSRSAESQGRPGSRSAESQGRPGSSGGERVPNDGRVGSGGGRRGSSGRGSDYGHQQRQESAGGGAGRIGTFQPPDVFVLDEEEEPDEAGDEVLSPYVSQYEREYSMTGYLVNCRPVFRTGSMSFFPDPDSKPEMPLCYTSTVATISTFRAYCHLGRLHSCRLNEQHLPGQSRFSCVDASVHAHLVPQNLLSPALPRSLSDFLRKSSDYPQSSTYLSCTASRLSTPLARAALKLALRESTWARAGRRRLHRAKTMGILHGRKSTCGRPWRGQPTGACLYHES